MVLFIAAILQNFLIFINYCIFAKPTGFRFLLRQLLLITGFMILCAVSFMLFEKYMIVFTAFSFYIIGVYIFKNTFARTVNWIGINLTSFLIVDYLTVFLLSLIESKFQIVFNNFLYLVIVAFPTIFTSSFLSKRIKNLEDKILLLVIVPVTVLIYAVNIYSMKIELNSRNLIIIFMIFMIIVFIALLLLALYYRKKQQTYLNQYYQELENNFNDIREFRHDYKNLIVTLGMLVENNDMEEIKKFYKSIVKYEDNKNIHKSRNLEHISRIAISYLRGFIFSKIREAEMLMVEVLVEVPDPIKQINLNQIDLLRILGILMDNGIEEISQLGKGRVHIALIKKDKSVIILVENDCREDIESIYKLRKPNYSTKGEERGLGLAILDNIVDKKKQINHETLIQKNKFIQKIEIRD